MALLHTYCASVARGDEAPIAAKFARARKDPIGTLIAGMVGAGLRFRWSGATLEISGLGRLSDRDRALFHLHEDAVLARLREPGGDGAALLDHLQVWLEMVLTREDAERVINELPKSCGLDIETAARPGYRVDRPWLAITKKGERAKHQPRIKDKTALDPHKAMVRLVQVYSPLHEAVFIFDLDRVPIEYLDELGLWTGRKFVAHNAAFEAMMLAGRPLELIDSMQLAGLVLGCEFGSRTLANVAEQVLKIEAPKEQQLSDWGARFLSIPQVNYAAADATIPHRAARVMWRQLGDDERRCFKVQNAAVPAIARMRLAGCPFVPEIHHETIRKWELEHAEERARFRDITGEEPPARDKVGRWLEVRLPAEEIAWMPRTETGTVSARSDLLKHLAHYEEIRPLLRVLRSDKRLRAFGYKLLEAISPITGRVHPDFMLGTKSGRLACSAPNFQQLPADVRPAIVAPAGRLLLCADYAQVELRILGELSGDEDLREEFRRGGDVHRAAAAAIAGISVEQVTAEQRKAAKAIVFGTVYGSGAGGIRATAWANFDVNLTLEQAGAARQAFLNRYPGVRAYQHHQADLADATGVVRSVLGRPLKTEWENGRLRYTQAVNFPIQASAADTMLLAMAKVGQALPDAMVLQVHDELVLEVPEGEAEAAAATLVTCMTEAFAELFPQAPTAGLIEAKVRRCWGKPQEAATVAAHERTPETVPEGRLERLGVSRTPRTRKAATPPEVSAPPEESVRRFCAYIDERQAILLRRRQGQPRPWTLDPILDKHKFCCVFREDDRTTSWIRENWREPYATHENLWFAMALARQINLIDSLDEIGFPTTWDPERVAGVLQDRLARGQKAYTSAYRVATPRKGGSKAHYTAVEVLDPLLRDPPPLERAGTLESAFRMLTARPGFGGGGFLAYEVVTDLRHTRYLRDAADFMTWANAGPGAVRGLHRVWGRPVEARLSSTRALGEMRHLLEISPRYLGDHVPPLELRDVEHSLCEWDKYERIQLGQGQLAIFRPHRRRLPIGRGTASGR